MIISGSAMVASVEPEIVWVLSRTIRSFFILSFASLGILLEAPLSVYYYRTYRGIMSDEIAEEKRLIYTNYFLDFCLSGAEKS